MSKRTDKIDISTKSSKAEILEAYEDLKSRLEETSSISACDEKSEQIVRVEEKKIVEKASSYTVDGIVKGLAELGLHVGKALTELSDKLIQEEFKLLEIKKAIEIETHNLEEVRDIKVVASALSLMVQEYESKKKALQDETKQAEELLDSTIQEKRKEWEKEQVLHAAAIKERDETAARERMREKEEYDYNLSIIRKKDKDSYEQKKVEQEKALKEAKETQEKALMNREAAIAEKEAEFSELKKKVENFENLLSESVKKAEKEATISAEQKAKTTAQLYDKEIEGQKKVFELKIQNLQELVDKQAAQIDNLTKQLAEANSQVLAIATKAIEGASGAKTLSTVQEIALEQAKQSKLQK